MAFISELIVRKKVFFIVEVKLFFPQRRWQRVVFTYIRYLVSCRFEHLFVKGQAFVSLQKILVSFQKRGPQRSVDVIVSSSFLLTLMSASFLCVQVIRILRFEKLSKFGSSYRLILNSFFSSLRTASYSLMLFIIGSWLPGRYFSVYFSFDSSRLVLK